MTDRETKRIEERRESNVSEQLQQTGNPVSPPINQPFEPEGDMICASLVREIGRTTRWVDIKAAWESLVHVRRQQEHQLREGRWLSGDKSAYESGMTTDVEYEAMMNLRGRGSTSGE